MKNEVIEKYLKAYLIEHDVPLVRTHDLLKLYGMTKPFKDLGFDEAILSDISDVYTDDRYPGVLGFLPNGGPSIKQAQDFLVFAKGVAAKIRQEIIGD